MKGVLGIRKLIWCINSVLIAILVYVVVNFIPGNNTGNSTSAYPIPATEKLEIMPVKRSLLPVEHNIIIERNIFGPLKLSPTKEGLQRKNITAISVIKTKFRLCATVAGDNQIACAVIEDLRSKVQDVYKAGEIIEGARIEKIDRNKVVLFYGGQLEVLNLQTKHEILSFVEKNKGPIMTQRQVAPDPAGDILSFGRGINNKKFLRQVPAIEVFLDEVEVTPYFIEGEAKGLCITDLGDLSLARYFGLENGDVVQSVNGQILTNKQKAFQVLKKARSQSPINIQLLRNQQKVDLSFDIN